MLTRFIPNLFTLGNLFLGMLAILLAINGKYSSAAIMVIVAMLLDGLDGRVARALDAQSEFGKELDSLSDMVSFGAAPALIIFMVSFQDSMPILHGSQRRPFPSVVQFVWRDLTFARAFRVFHWFAHSGGWRCTGYAFYFTKTLAPLV